ncbi:MAG: CPBP family intramembrane glutamic endopeptidase [Fidelibacterota bacterium]
MKFKAPKISVTVVLFLGGMALGFTIAILLMMVRIAQNPDNINTYSQFSLLLGEALIPLPILIWAIKKKQSLKTVFRFNSVKLNYFIFAILAGIGLVIVSDELERLIGMFVTIPDQFAQLDKLLTISNWPSALLIISSIALIGPMAEEMVFRGFLQQSLEENMKDVTQAVIYTALAFTLVHFNIYWALNIFIIGFFLSFIGWKTNSIWPTFTIHLINNSLALVFVHFEETIAKYYLFHGHVHPLIFLTGVFVLGIFMVKLSKLENCE